MKDKDKNESKELQIFNNPEFVEDCARNNPHKHVQNFEWYVDYLLPIVQRDFMN